MFRLLGLPAHRLVTVPARISRC